MRMGLDVKERGGGRGEGDEWIDGGSNFVGGVFGVFRKGK